MTIVCIDQLLLELTKPTYFILKKQQKAQDVAVIIYKMKISEGLAYILQPPATLLTLYSLDKDTLLDSVTASDTNRTGKVVTASHALCYMAKRLQKNY